uniref:Putative secreted protein n=1 Tax=Ixodes ricinus TaxID=34613 RepID=A0A6B0V0F9_IXORI
MMMMLVACAIARVVCHFWRTRRVLVLAGRGCGGLLQMGRFLKRRTHFAGIRATRFTPRCLVDVVELGDSGPVAVVLVAVFPPHALAHADLGVDESVRRRHGVVSTVVSVHGLLPIRLVAVVWSFRLLRLEEVVAAMVARASLPDAATVADSSRLSSCGRVNSALPAEAAGRRDVARTRCAVPV